ncbi:ATP-binding protein, partial [Hymenobacter sp. ASUV-10]
MVSGERTSLRGECIVRWAGQWLLLLVLAVGGRSGQAQAIRPEHRASWARVQALLGPPPAVDESVSWIAALSSKAFVPEAQATPRPALVREQQRLWSVRQQWTSEPLAFVVWTRLALNSAAQRRPDSAVAYLRRAIAAVSHTSGYPLEAAELHWRLSNYYWERQQADSALQHHQHEIRLLEHSGHRAGARRSQPLAFGDSLEVGVALGGAYANTGLARRRRGDYPGAVRAYVRGLRAYQLAHHSAGELWVQNLLGEAYEEQANDTQAAAYYAAARRTARAMRATDRPAAVLNFAETLGYAYQLLLRQGRTAELLSLLNEGIAEARQAQRDTAAWRLAGAVAMLELRRAEMYLRIRQPAPAAAALQRAAADLTSLEQQLPTPTLRRYFNFSYYGWRAHEQALRGWQAHAAGQPLDPAWTRRALAYADSLEAPAARASLHLELADYLLRTDDPTAAAALLRQAQQHFRAARNRLKLREVYQLQAQAYAALGRWQPAYQAREQLSQLTDSLRAAQQYAALADVETRYRTQAKEAQIIQLQERNGQQRQQKWLAATGAGLLALLLGGAAWVLRRTRQLNRSLEEQRALLATQAEQLTELDRAKSAFFANVSHELRTPLTLIVGPLEHLLRPEAPVWQPAELRERLALPLRNGRRLQGLVNGLLDFSKLDAGKLVVHPMTVQAAEFFRHLLSLFESLAQERGVALRGTVALPDDLMLLFDADKVEQVVTNLLSNALKFTPRGGQVTLAVAPAGPNAYQLTVTDTGPGIALAEQARVFERFYQSPAQQGQGGTGIGLALSRELAELLGGQLTLQSRPGTGSTFSFTFQVLPAPPPPPTAPAIEAEIIDAPVPAGPRPRVLVVEDHADLRAYLRQILQPHYEVLEAENGRVALQVLAREPVDLISSDAMMPELGGLELLARV